MMKNHPIVTEWEANVLFDADDPDFCDLTPSVASVLRPGGAIITTTSNNNDHLNNNNNNNNNNGSSNNNNNSVSESGPPTKAHSTTVNPNALNASTMSLASVHGPQFADICSPLGRSSISMSSSLSDLVGSPLEISMDNVLSIEELRQQMGSCFTCGVSWTDDHVSLDCSECGGYSLERPCPLCDGQCDVLWKRDFTMSHACGKARWQGVCPSYPEAALNAAIAAAPPTTCATAATQLRLAQELCARLEQLSASAAAHM